MVPKLLMFCGIIGISKTEFFSFLGTERVKYNIFDNDAFFTLSMELLYVLLGNNFIMPNSYVAIF